MGRKIKGRKHRGVRDPEKQRQLKLASLQNKINAPPINPNEQQIPKSLSHLMNLKEKIQSGRISMKRKRKPKKKIGPVTSHPHGYRYDSSEKAIPFFEQEPGESDRKFMWRVNQICKSVIDEAAFEDKYGVDIKRNPDTGQVEGVTKRKKDELELYIKQIKKEKKLKKKNKLKSDINKVRLTKSQKKQIKLKQKKESKLHLKIDEFKDYEDKVKFGEVAHEPPTLTAPRKITVAEIPRPGKRDLLLKSMIDSNKKEPEVLKKQEKLRKITNKVIDKKGKRRDLPNALRRQLDKQQQEVIEAYKKMKAKRYNSQ